MALAGGAALVGGAIGRVAAATNQVVLTTNAQVPATCIVTAQPSKLTMSYDAVANTATLGTSSFTYNCSKGAAVTVTPASANLASAPNWKAVTGSNNLLYTLWNSTTCTTGQLTNGTSEALGNGTGSPQTYNICAIPNLGQQTLPAGTYVDTVTFTFNFGP